MGLDITLGVIIFLAAVRGWLKGFLHQAVRMAGLVASLFLADPVRRELRPHVAPYFTSIQPAMLDRILWWLASVVSYLALVGVASLLIAIARRPNEYGVKASYPNDRFAGFLFGAAKGALIAVFLTAAIEKYALAQLKTMPWAEQQVSSSKALAWNQAYEPVPRIWQSQPIQLLVNHVQKMGLPATDAVVPEKPAGPVADRTAQKGDSRPPRLEVAPGDASASTSLGSEIEAALEDIKSRIDDKTSGQ